MENFGSRVDHSIRPKLEDVILVIPFPPDYCYRKRNKLLMKLTSFIKILVFLDIFIPWSKNINSIFLHWYPSITWKNLIINFQSTFTSAQLEKIRLRPMNTKMTVSLMIMKCRMNKRWTKNDTLKLTYLNLEQKKRLFLIETLQVILSEIY